MIHLNVNGSVHAVEAEPDTPLLWVIREQVGLTGTKYGCGIAQCGACTVHLDGQAVRACSLPVSAVEPDFETVTRPVRLKLTLFSTWSKRIGSTLSRK